jgi:hypothetical protein
MRIFLVCVYFACGFIIYWYFHSAHVLVVHTYLISKDNLQVHIHIHIQPHIRDIIQAFRQIAAHTSSHVIKAGHCALLTSTYVYIHRPLNITSLAAWKNLQANGT